MNAKMKNHPVMQRLKADLAQKLYGDPMAPIRPGDLEKLGQQQGLSDEALSAFQDDGDPGRMSPYTLGMLAQVAGHDSLHGLQEAARVGQEDLPDLPFLQKKALKVFVSYAHQDDDSACLERVRVHLTPLMQEGGLDLWDDSRIAVGQNWAQAIEEALNGAHAAILLVSADFLASSFITENELPPLLEKAAEQGTLIVPVIIKYCGFEDDPSLSVFQALNPPDVPLLSLPDIRQEYYWNKLRKVILEFIENHPEQYQARLPKH